MQELKTYTEQLEREIEQLDLPQSPANLYDPLRYFMSLGGKRMRPILTLLGTQLFGKNPSSALHAALSVEVFHNFTLIHDDIMDEAPLRRNKETVHKKWNLSIAILSGDVLFVKAYQLLAMQEHRHLPELLDLFNKTAIEVCEGQQLDMDFEKRNDVSIPEYIEMIRLKTSVLLGCALEMGAIIADASATDRKNLYEFGQHLGIAFQIQDDILDLYADPDKFGKQVGGDVIADKKTLLKLKAEELADPIQRELLRQLEKETDHTAKVKHTRELYTLMGVREACEAEMKEHYDFAMQSLQAIHVNLDDKAPLIALADYLMNREH
jgi:geranylgeranyl diphosphate synthase type II